MELAGPADRPREKGRENGRDQAGRIAASTGDAPARRKINWYVDYVATGGYAALKKALDMKPEEIIKTTIDSGLRGRGGAGFSAGQKWSFIPKEKKGPHYMAVNFDESEPGTFKDRYLSDYDPHMLLEGIAIAAIATQCDVAYVFIHGESHRQ